MAGTVSVGSLCRFPSRRTMEGHRGPQRKADRRDASDASLRLTEELKALATAQAARAGVSLNQYIATVLAAHAEAERTFAARAARPRPGATRAILARAGKRRPRAEDRLDAE
jgi:hypothetical protein